MSSAASRNHQLYCQSFQKEMVGRCMRCENTEKIKDDTDAGYNPAAPVRLTSGVSHQYVQMSITWGRVADYFINDEVKFEMKRLSLTAGWRCSSGRQPLVHPASLCRPLKLPQCRLFVLRLGEDDAVVKPVGLPLPELDQVRLDDVAAPVKLMGTSEAHESTFRVLDSYLFLCNGTFSAHFPKCSSTALKISNEITLGNIYWGF